ncbi:MAG: hypothetical protein LBU70_04335 [Chitinispirillales bacterium]|nr:hypothetical protein [Chitinispirillales bacterium]
MKTVAAKEAEPLKPRSMWAEIFTKVITMLLRGYKVDIYTEYELYKKPMRIDIVVINLLEDVVIENTVMRFFKKHNVVEFKGPKETLNIGAFDKVLSYFYAYLSQKSARFDETTITFVSTKHPKKLLKILREDRKYKIIASESRGIYYITIEGVPFAHAPAMQLVVSNELSAADAEWIKAVRDDWTAEYGVEVLEKVENTADSQLREIAHLLWLANNNNWKEGGMHPVLEKRLMKLMVESGAAEKLRLEGWQGGLQEGWQEGRQEGQQEGWREGIEEERKKNAKAMKAEGIDVKIIAKITGLTANAIKRM